MVSGTGHSGSLHPPNSHIFSNTLLLTKTHPTAGMPLPSIYTTAFDLAQPVGGKITVLAINKILGVSGLPPATVDKVCPQKKKKKKKKVEA